MDKGSPSPRRAWAATAVLAYPNGMVTSAILTLAETKVDAITAAIREATKALPPGMGDSFGIVASHATPIAPDVVRAAADEISPAQAG